MSTIYNIACHKTKYNLRMLSIIIIQQFLIITEQCSINRNIEFIGCNSTFSDYTLEIGVSEHFLGPGRGGLSGPC